MKWARPLSLNIEESSARGLERRAMKRFHVAFGVSDGEAFPSSVM